MYWLMEMFIPSPIFFMPLGVVGATAPPYSINPSKYKRNQCSLMGVHNKVFISMGMEVSDRQELIVNMSGDDRVRI